MVYKEEKKLDVRLPIRGPRALAERIESIQKEEGIASRNKLMLSLLETGISARDWAAKNWDDIQRIRERGESLHFNSILPRILATGLEALSWMAAHREEIGASKVSQLLDEALAARSKSGKSP